MEKQPHWMGERRNRQRSVAFPFVTGISDHDKKRSYEASS